MDCAAACSCFKLSTEISTTDNRCSKNRQPKVWRALFIPPFIPEESKLDVHLQVGDKVWRGRFSFSKTTWSENSVTRCTVLWHYCRCANQTTENVGEPPVGIATNATHFLLLLRLEAQAASPTSEAFRIISSQFRLGVLSRLLDLPDVNWTDLAKVRFQIDMLDHLSSGSIRRLVTDAFHFQNVASSRIWSNAAWLSPVAKIGHVLGSQAFRCFMCSANRKRLSVSRRNEGHGTEHRVHSSISVKTNEEFTHWIEWAKYIYDDFHGMRT